MPSSLQLTHRNRDNAGQAPSWHGPVYRKQTKDARPSYKSSLPSPSYPPPPSSGHWSSTEHLTHIGPSSYHGFPGIHPRQRIATTNRQRHSPHLQGPLLATFLGKEQAQGGLVGECPSHILRFL